MLSVRLFVVVGLCLWTQLAGSGVAHGQSTVSPGRRLVAHAPVIDIDLEETRAYGAEEFTDFIGRPVLLYEITFTTARMKHYQEFTEDYADRGLAVVGLIPAGQDPQAVADEYGIKHWAAERNRVSRRKKVVSFGDAGLFDSYGMLVCRYQVNAEDIEAHLDGQLASPIWEWGSDAARVLAEMKKDKIEKAVLKAQEDVLELWADWHGDRRNAERAKAFLKKLDKIAKTANSERLDSQVADFQAELEVLASG